ncbi:MAG: hypothetical protein FJW31_05725 [Acidobacteria bacterium]|nr:hypothetical protein [Acidobacteriota bacterium]
MPSPRLLLFVSLPLFAKGTPADYERFVKLRERLAATNFVAAEPASALGDAPRFWYCRSIAGGGHEFIAVDAATGEKFPAFDAVKVAAALSRTAGKEYAPQKLPFTSFGPIDRVAIEFFAADARWRVNLNSYICERLPLRRSDPQPLRSLPGPRVPQTDKPVESKSNEWRAFIRNFNVWLQAMGAKDAVPLSFDGSEGNYYVLSEAAWAPDSTKLAAYRVRPGQRRKIPYIECSPAAEVQPKHTLVEYAKPGDTLDVPRPVLFDIAT